MPSFGDLIGKDHVLFAELLSRVAVQCLEGLHMAHAGEDTLVSTKLFSNMFYFDAHENDLIDESAINEVSTDRTAQREVLADLLGVYKEMASVSVEYGEHCKDWILKQWAPEPQRAVFEMVCREAEKRFGDLDSPFASLPVHKAHHIAIMDTNDEKESEAENEASEEEEDEDEDEDKSSSAEESNEDDKSNVYESSAEDEASDYEARTPAKRPRTEDEAST